MNIEYTAKKIMQERGWSQAELAKAVGVHPVTLSRLLSRLKRQKRYSSYEKLLCFLSTGMQLVPATPSTPTEPEEVNHDMA